jgi:hypothetical protein
MHDLTPSQRDVVNCDNKYYLVPASAGSGKTFVLTERIKRLLSGLRRGGKVLALNFTNKAARELRDRLLKSYAADELAAKAVVGNIHSRKETTGYASGALNGSTTNKCFVTEDPAPTMVHAAGGPHAAGTRSKCKYRVYHTRAGSVCTT